MNECRLKKDHFKRIRRIIESNQHNLHLICWVSFKYIQVVPGRAGGGSFKRKKNHIAEKEFAYRMCARWPTIALSKLFVWVWTKLLPLHGCDVMTCFQVMWLVVRWFVVLLRYYSVLQRPTTYYSRSTLYYKVLLQYYKVLCQCYKILL